MARTLNGTLLTAQTAVARKPICNLIIGKGENEIPFPDNPGVFMEESVQHYPKPIYLADSRIAVFYANQGHNSGAGISGLRVRFSDTGRTVFGSEIEVDDVYAFYSTIYGISAIELEDGNMGVVAHYDGNWYAQLQAFKVSPTGVKLATGTVWSFGHWQGPKGFSLVRQGINSYAIIYIKQDNSIAKRLTSNFTSWSTEELIYTAT